MTTRVGIRDLRNRTAEIIELARVEGEVVITSHHAPVAVLRPVVDRRDQEIDRIITAGHRLARRTPTVVVPHA